MALRTVRDAGLYRDVGYKTFEAYCAERWDMSRPSAYRLVDAANVREVLSPMGDKLPENERQLRPLLIFRDAPELQIAAWLEVIETAPDGSGAMEHARGLQHVTSAHGALLQSRRPVNQSRRSIRLGIRAVTIVGHE
jgi:hypothetical protein